MVTRATWKGANMTAPAIELRRVSRRFRGATVLDELDLELMPGIVGLLGPNGAGKTTLLRILATVLGADGGSVRILGSDPADTAARTQIRRRLGYLPQELQYPRGFTAYRFVEYMAVLKEIEESAARRAEVRRVLEDVDLADRAAKPIRTLSGGQRRRVGLAQALLGSPELLVLDEPTTGLDPEQRVALRTVLAERGRASTVLIATHQTEDVAALCEHVVVLDRGSVSFQGTVSALVAEAQRRVWLADTADPRAHVSWRTATGRYRNLGDAPAGAELVEPTLEDAYLLLRGATEPEAVAA
jgi:ABC-2 type transport system ATP-binding protein